jgi:hypothetical protein
MQSLAERTRAKKGEYVDARREVAADNQFENGAAIVKAWREAIIYVEFVFKSSTKRAPFAQRPPKRRNTIVEIPRVISMRLQQLECSIGLLPLELMIVRNPAFAEVIVGCLDNLIATRTCFS